MEKERYDLLFSADEFLHKGLIEKVYATFTNISRDNDKLFVSFASDEDRMACLMNIKGYAKFVAPVEYEKKCEVEEPVKGFAAWFEALKGWVTNEQK